MLSVLKSNNSCGLFVVLFLLHVTDDQALNMTTFKAVFKCSYTVLSFSLQACILNYRLLTVGSFSDRYSWIFVGICKVCCDVQILN